MTVLSSSGSGPGPPPLPVSSLTISFGSAVTSSVNFHLASLGKAMLRLPDPSWQLSVYGVPTVTTPLAPAWPQFVFGGVVYLSLAILNS